MPKMKTHKGAAKRFRLTGSDKMVRAAGRRGHFRRRMSLRILQHLDRTFEVHKSVQRRLRRALPYIAKHSR
jgi:large subunit ribosomal protein L35